MVSALLSGSVNALSGNFSLGYSTTSEQIWSSSGKEPVTVTVKVTSAAADTYADTTRSSVTVQTDNHQIALHVGETETIEDQATDSVWLYENPGYDHNGYAYYGIVGTWEVTVQSGGLGVPGLSGGGTGAWTWLGLAAIVAVAVVGVLFYARKTSRTRSHTLTTWPVTSTQGPGVSVACPKCQLASPPAAMYCERCGTRLR